MIEIKKVSEQEHTPTNTDDMTTDTPDRNMNDMINSIIEEDLKNFEITESNSDEEIEDTEIKTDISEETAKIKDLLESIILVMLFVMAMRHKNIENKQKVVMDFVNERKEVINRICVCMEKTIARNEELYKKMQKANDISFIIQLVILALEFEGILNEMERKTLGVEKQIEKKSKGEKQRTKQEQEKQTINNTTKPTEIGEYAEAW